MTAPAGSEKAEHNVIFLPSSEVHDGNYFAMGKSVEISGTVNGDVYVLAQQVVIDGVVNGDVLCSGGSIDISGRVLHNCRLAGGQILISGSVGDSVTAVAGNLQVLPSAAIGGSIVVTAGNVDLASSVGLDATIVASTLRLSSHIHKNLQGYVGEMRITSRAIVDGDVDYRSNAPAWIEPGSTIRGHIVHHPSFVHELVQGTWIQDVLLGSKMLVILMNFIYTFVIGVALLKIFPKNLEATLHILKTSPLKALTYGIMLLILLPLASLILLMTILGVPFALALIAANIVGFYTAKVYTIFWASNWMFSKVGFKHNRLPSYFLGTLLYFALAAVPFIGMGITLGCMLFGLGAGVLAQTKRTLWDK